MKRIISENRLNNIINEAIQEATLRNTVRQMVIEELSRLNERGKKKGGHDDDENTKTFVSIMQGPHEEKYNVSDFGREVLADRYPSMSDDALRSLASKITRGKRKMPPGLGAKAMQWVREK